MAIDLAKFAKAFYEEAQEHLAAMESLLVAAESGHASDESLHALFRAVHSVKGGAAAFGHEELTAFTHHVEALLDRLRKHEIALTPPLVTLLLQSGDVMRAHVAALDRGTPPDAAALDAMRAALDGLSEKDLQAAPSIAEEDDDDDFGFFAPLEEEAAEPAAACEETHDVAVHEPALAADATSIRVNIAKVDSLINLVGELVITEAMLGEAARALEYDREGRFAAALGQLQRNTRSLQESILGIRMLPISFVVSRLPRLVRDVAARLGKLVDLEIDGEDTELDKRLIEQVTDPLVHVVRNAIDHGIETPEQRVAAGKPARGRVSVHAKHQGGMIVIRVRDDGAGLDRARILAKAAELGLEADPSWSDAQVWRLVFAPGFSTSAVVTDVSGRGVGMDVVSRNVDALGGSVEIESVAGEGTTLTIRLPLTLAILDAMSVAIDGETYILPLANVEQSLQADEGQLRPVGGRATLSLAGDIIPVIGLDDVFAGADRGTAERQVLVVLESEGRRAALRVDDLLGQHQVVLKSLEDHYRKVGGLTGATILGDGRVAFILDVAYLVTRAHGTSRSPSATHEPRLP